jgi:MFS family permease
MLADRYSPQDRGRAVGFYIASMSLSCALSLIISGAALQSGDYRIAFFLTCLGPLVGFILAWITLASTFNKIHPRSEEQKFSKEILRNKPAVLFISAYTSHNWELMGMWAWTPAFVSACLMLKGSEAWAATGSGSQIVGLFHLMGVLASLTMGMLSDKLGRALLIFLVTGVSTSCSFTIGWMVGFPMFLIIVVGMIYSFFALADSPIISAGMTESVDPSYLGAAFALRSFLGFSASAIAPLAFGAILDWTNPNIAADGFYTTWGWAFCVLGLGGLGAVVAAYLLYKQRT